MHRLIASNAYRRGLASYARCAPKELSAAAAFTPESTLVTPAWLHKNLASVRVLDASWYLPASNRNPRDEFKKLRIPTAGFFDIDAVCDALSPLPHMLPPTDIDFAKHAARLGIKKRVPVVIYDTSGIFSAPRAWLTLKLFGHEHVAVLNGGLPRWQAEGYPVDTTPLPAETAAASASTPTDLEDWKLDKNAVWSMGRIVKLAQQRTASGSSRSPLRISPSDPVVVDARSEARFLGDAPEPRPNSAQGHIPGSASMPFTTLLDEQQRCYLSPDDIRKKFAAAKVDVDRPGKIVASCGSGLTACVVAMGLALAGRRLEDIAFYDGSWAEYGTTPGVPVEKGPSRLA